MQNRVHSFWSGRKQHLFIFSYPASNDKSIYTPTHKHAFDSLLPEEAIIISMNENSLPQSDRQFRIRDPSPYSISGCLWWNFIPAFTTKESCRGSTTIVPRWQTDLREPVCDLYCERNRSYRDRSLMMRPSGIWISLCVGRFRKLFRNPFADIFCLAVR